MWNFFQKKNRRTLFSRRVISERRILPNKGMTLLEVLLYVTISSFLLFVASGVLSTIYDIKLKGKIIQAVEEEGSVISYAIKNYTQNATTVYDPGLFREGERLTVVIPKETGDSVVSIFLENEKLQAIIDNKEEVALSSSAVKVSNVVFKYFGSSEKGFISYEFTITGGDSNGRNIYSKNYQGGASIR